MILFIFSAALDVQMSDASFTEQFFEVVSGGLHAKWNRIAPGTNVTHVVILKALEASYFNFTSAEVSYQPAENAERVVSISFGCC